MKVKGYIQIVLKQRKIKSYKNLFSLKT